MSGRYHSPNGAHGCYSGVIWDGALPFVVLESPCSARKMARVTLRSVVQGAEGRGLSLRCGRLARAFALTEREGEVFELLARGRNTAFIMRELHISRSTAKTHVRHIYQKMGVSNHQELIDLVEGEVR